jgi:hypothetical protein
VQLLRLHVKLSRSRSQATKGDRCGLVVSQATVAVRTGESGCRRRAAVMLAFAEVTASSRVGTGGMNRVKSQLEAGRSWESILDDASAEGDHAQSWLEGCPSPVGPEAQEPNAV